MSAFPSCGRKVSYPTEAAAKAVRARKSARLRVYRCARCAGWHLTKKTDPYGAGTGKLLGRGRILR